MAIEILFKAKRVDNGEWVYGYYSFLSTMGKQPIHRISCNEEWGSWGYEINPNTLCQYTRLDDKNGVKIFEGDIIQAHDYPKDRLTFEVVWIDIHAGFNLMGLNTKAMIVIGNIHDKEN